MQRINIQNKKTQLANSSFKGGKPQPKSRRAPRSEIVPVLRNQPSHFAQASDGTYVAICCRLPSLVATGATLHEAQANLAEMLTSRMETIEKDKEQDRLSWLARAWHPDAEGALATE
jgi:predicted RNase H-like HicB family nuclease